MSPSRPSLATLARFRYARVIVCQPLSPLCLHPVTPIMTRCRWRRRSHHQTHVCWPVETRTRPCPRRDHPWRDRCCRVGHIAIISLCCRVDQIDVILVFCCRKGNAPPSTVLSRRWALNPRLAYARRCSAERHSVRISFCVERPPVLFALAPLSP